MEHEGRLINALLEPVYNRPGRLARLMHANGDTEDVRIGQPQQAGASPMRPGMPAPQQPPQYRLTPDAQFNVAIKIAKSFDTRREQEAAELGDIIQSAPGLLNVLGDLYFKNQDGPGASEIAERMKAVLDPKVQAAMSGGQPSPEQAHQQLQQAGTMIEQLSKHVKDLTQQIQTKQVEAQAKLQEASMDNASREKIALINASAQLAAVGQKVDAENARTFVDAFENRIAKTLDLHMARVQDAMQRLHEHQTQAHAQAHDAGMAALEHQHTLDAASQAAALAPEPVEEPV
jgi:hypothetical protein